MGHTYNRSYRGSPILKSQQRPEAHGGGDEGQGQVGHNTDQGDVSEGEQGHEHGPEGDARVPRVLPVHQRVHLVRRQPHLKFYNRF